MPSSSFIFAINIFLLKRTFEHSRMFPLLQVISETLRVANLIGGVFRRANTDIHFKGYFSRKPFPSLPSSYQLRYSFIHL